MVSVHLAEPRPFAVIWRGEEPGHFKDFLRTFGLSVSPDEAEAKVRRRLAGDPAFRRRHEGGTFLVVDVRRAVPNPRRS